MNVRGERKCVCKTPQMVIKNDQNVKSKYCIYTPPPPILKALQNLPENE